MRNDVVLGKDMADGGTVCHQLMQAGREPRHVVYLLIPSVGKLQMPQKRELRSNSFAFKRNISFMWSFKTLG